MGRFIYEARRACTRVINAPFNSGVIVACLSFAIAICASILSTTRAIWFTPWNAGDASALRIVVPEVSMDNWKTWRTNARSFSELAARSGAALVRVDGEVTRVDCVSDDFFHVLRIRPRLGSFSAFGAPADSGASVIAAVVSRNFWRDKLQSRPDAVGTSISVDPIGGIRRRIRLTVVAVADFNGPDVIATQMWLPLDQLSNACRPTEASNPESNRLVVFGRLANGVRADRARDEIQALAEATPRNNTRVTQIVIRGTELSADRESSGLATASWQGVIFASIVVVLIACANVTNLMFARAHSAEREFTIALALGADPAYVARALLLECGLLSIVAAAIGLAISAVLPRFVLHTFVQGVSPTLAQQLQLTFPIDVAVVAGALACALLACFSFGVAPALMASNQPPSEVLRLCGAGSSSRQLPSLLSYQLILSVTALALGALILRSSQGFQSRQIVSMFDHHTVVTSNGQQKAIFDLLSTSVGAENVAGLSDVIRVGSMQVFRVTPGYFSTMNMTLVKGRVFKDSDPGQCEAVISEEFAERLASVGGSIGRDLNGAAQWDPQLGGCVLTGIVHSPLHRAEAYLRLDVEHAAAVIARAAPATIELAIQEHRATSGLPPNVRVLVSDAQAWIRPTLGPTLLIGRFTLAFGLTALAVSAIGLFSFFQFFVEQRLGEMAVRRALGARTVHLISAAVGPAILPMLRGLLFGICCAVAIGFVLARAELPSGITPWDIAAYVYTATTIIAMLTIAAVGPVCRCMLAEPRSVLRAN